MYFTTDVGRPFFAPYPPDSHPAHGWNCTDPRKLTQFGFQVGDRLAFPKLGVGRTGGLPDSRDV